MNILVAGLGRSGLNLAAFLNLKGHSVWGTDSSGKEFSDPEETSCFVNFETSGHSKFLDMDFHSIVLSPGIPPENELARHFMDRKMTVTGELDILAPHIKEYVKSERHVTGVTGTNGKTTTSELIGNIYRVSGDDCPVCGNNGRAVSKVLYEKEKARKSLNRETESYDSMVIEMSSFMIDRMGSFRPGIFIILNMRPDHLDRYSDVEQYYDSKFAAALSLQQGSSLIFNMDCAVTISRVTDNLEHFNKRKISLIGFTMKSLKQACGNRSDSCEQIEKLYEKVKKINYKNLETALYDRASKNIFFEKSERKVSLEGYRLKGDHNIENALAAVSAAVARKIDSMSIEKGLTTFRTVVHRMEPVIDRPEILVVNDSKATNVDSTLKALASYEEKIILVAGGYDKNEEMLPLAQEIVRRDVKAVILLGQTSPKIRQALEKSGYSGDVFQEDTLESTVENAYLKTLECFSSDKKRGVFLFSPACASYGLFKDFEQRGSLFKESVLRFSSTLEQTSVLESDENE